MQWTNLKIYHHFSLAQIIIRDRKKRIIIILSPKFGIFHNSLHNQEIFVFVLNALKVFFRAPSIPWWIGTTRLRWENGHNGFTEQFISFSLKIRFLQPKSNLILICRSINNASHYFGYIVTISRFLFSLRDVVCCYNIILRVSPFKFFLE